MPAMIPRRVPDSRHPFPDLRTAFGAAGWSFFSTRDARGGVTAHAVLCASLPAACAKARGFTEHLWGPPEELRVRVPVAVAVLRRHAQACPSCAHALSIAARYAVQQ